MMVDRVEDALLNKTNNLEDSDQSMIGSEWLEEEDDRMEEELGDDMTLGQV